MSLLKTSISPYFCSARRTARRSDRLRGIGETLTNIDRMEAGSRSRSLAVDCAMVDARMRTKIRVDGELYGGVGGLYDHDCGKLSEIGKHHRWGITRYLIGQFETAHRAHLSAC